MKKEIKAATVISTMLISSNALGAAGIDRYVFSPSVLFEDGNYVSVSVARSNPKASTSFAPSANVADDINTFLLGYKHQISDKFAVGLLVNNQPVGVNVDYSALNSPLRGTVRSISYTAMGLYNATDHISIFGGLKYQRQKGFADLTPSGVPAATNFKVGSDTGIIAGAAYSIPKIGLRASLSYESRLEFNHDTSFLGSTDNIGTTTSAAPAAYTLELQSGIAENTLLFGSIRHANWSDADVIFTLGDTNLSSFDDRTVYTLGIGRKFNDSFSASIATIYEKKIGKPVSGLGPTDGELGFEIGGEYTFKNGIKTSLGVNYTKFGDAVTEEGLPFTDNDIITVGLKISKNF